MRDFKDLREGTPSWNGNLPLGHGGDLFSPDGGLFGKAGINWMEYLFRGSQAANQYLTDGWRADKWTVEMKSMHLLHPMVKKEHRKGTTIG